MSSSILKPVLATGAIALATYGVLFQKQISAFWAGRTTAPEPSNIAAHEENSTEVVFTTAREPSAPRDPFALRDQRVMCGQGWSTSCMLIPVPGVHEHPGSRPKYDATEEDRAFCKAYYRYYVRTGQIDVEADSHCYALWLTPVMIPDTSR